MSATYKLASWQDFGAGANISNRPMLVALSVAALLHAILMVGVGFELPEPRPINQRNIEVMLVTQAAPKPLSLDPNSVKARADRSGETQVPLPEIEAQADPIVENDALATDDAPQTELTPASAPEPASIPEFQPMPRPEAAQGSAPEPEPVPVPEPEPEPEPAPEPEPKLPRADMLSSEPSPLAMEAPPMASAADILASRNNEITRLTARINAQTNAYQNRARRKAISTSTREYRYASYMEAWRRKVERIGNLNYPSEARDQGLYGNLILHVAVRADGSLEGIRVVRSSGQEVLDQAAVRIVELAAPFAEFPPDIAAETDVLDITRTWQFQRNHRLGWDN